MDKVKMIQKLEKIQRDHSEQKFIIETSEGTVSFRIGDAMIYEGMNGEIVIDAE